MSIFELSLCGLMRFVDNDEVYPPSSDDKAVSTSGDLLYAKNRVFVVLERWGGYLAAPDRASASEASASAKNFFGGML
jgi:hypothetical protein